MNELLKINLSFFLPSPPPPNLENIWNTQGLNLYNCGYLHLDLLKYLKLKWFSLLILTVINNTHLIAFVGSPSGAAGAVCRWPVESRAL